MELKQCVNSSWCLPRKPKLVVGLRGATSSTFVDNAAYRNFLVRTFWCFIHRYGEFSCNYGKFLNHSIIYILPVIKLVFNLYHLQIDFLIYIYIYI